MFEARLHEPAKSAERLRSLAVLVIESVREDRPDLLRTTAGAPVYKARVDFFAALDGAGPPARLASVEFVKPPAAPNRVVMYDLDRRR